MKELQFKHKTENIKVTFNQDSGEAVFEGPGLFERTLTLPLSFFKDSQDWELPITPGDIVVRVWGSGHETLGIATHEFFDAAKKTVDFEEEFTHFLAFEEFSREGGGATRYANYRRGTYEYKHIHTDFKILQVDMEKCDILGIKYLPTSHVILKKGDSETEKTYGSTEIKVTKNDIKLELKKEHSLKDIPNITL